MAPRSADSPQERPSREARFVRSPTVGCRTRRTPSFRTLADNCGSGRQAGLPFLSLTGLFPSHPYVRHRLFLHRRQCRERLGEPSGGASPAVRSARGRTHPLGQARAQRTGQCSPARCCAGWFMASDLRRWRRVFQARSIRTSYSGVEGLGEGMVSGFYIDRPRCRAPARGG